MKKFLIVGSGGRESAFALKLSEENIALYAVVDHENPTIIDCVQATGGRYLVAKTTDAAAISQFAVRHKIDYAFVNADDPLAHGVVDELLKHKIKAVGGTQAATRIEWDKVYALQLMERVCPEFTPMYKVVSRPEEIAAALNAFKKRKLLVVVKPQGLTGGKGVKVMREHLRSYQASADYAASLLRRNKAAKVLFVEKLNGIEFTIMGFSDGKHLVMAPASYDYPYRRENDKGAGTGGMGCFTNTNKKLPFMSDKDWAACRTMMQRVIRALREEKLPFKGVLNGGFFKTRDGMRFMEFNARFGDPEALNILALLQTPLAAIIKDLYHGRLRAQRVKFIRKASVVKYLVAKEYPERSARKLRFSVAEKAIVDDNINIFYASCVRAAGKASAQKKIGAAKADVAKTDVLFDTLKKSRVLALGKVHSSIADASDAINRAIADHIDGRLEYRRDIGAPKSLQKLMAINKDLE